MNKRETKKKENKDEKIEKIKKAIDAKILDKKFNKLKWISIYYPDSPEKEISELKEAIKIIKKDNRNKTCDLSRQHNSSYCYARKRRR